MMHPPTVYFDGSAAPNPGSIEVAVHHAGADHSARIGARGGSNAAEFHAALAALAFIDDMELSNVVLVGDSRTVVDALAPAGRPLHLEADLQALADRCRSHPGWPRIAAARWVHRDHNLAGKLFERRQEAAKKVRQRRNRAARRAGAQAVGGP